VPVVISPLQLTTPIARWDHIAGGGSGLSEAITDTIIASMDVAQRAFGSVATAHHFSNWRLVTYSEEPQHKQQRHGYT